jgi:uncharacterized protein with HEPN domain
MTGRPLRVGHYLEHVLAAIDRINRYTGDIDFDAFVASDMRQDAVIRNFEIIGEACRNIVRADPAFPSRYPDLPLRAAMEMRNVLAHAYFGVDLSVVWRTIQSDLPGLEQGVRQALAETRRD